MANPIKIKCCVSSITCHDDNVFSVTLQPERRIPKFLPGQFMHIALDSYDPTIGYWPESRVFSIASAPSDNHISFAYSVVGPFTANMKRQLAVGKEVWVRLPYGHFTVKASPDEEVVMVAGGTGVTPFISFILHEMQCPSNLSVTLVYGVKKTSLFLFQDILLEAIARLDRFQCLFFAEQIDHDEKRFSVRQGRLSLDGIWETVSDPLNAAFYLSGPLEMIHSFSAGLEEKGVKAEKIRIDDWE